MIEKPFPSFLWCTYERKNASDGEFTYLGRLLNQKNVTFKHQPLSWGPWKILHRRGRSCGSRLSICQTQAIKKLQILRRQCCLPDSCPKRSLGEILWSHQEKSSFATFKRNPYENSLWACKNLSDQTKLTNIVMKPLLRHFRGQHDLKTVFRSSFRPEMAEK